jgi:hypothetical protein
MAAPYLALALAGPDLVELTGDAALVRRWDALPLAYTVLGIDRIDGRQPREVTLDASAVAAALAGRTSGARFLVAASPQRDHPYNLARRTVSLGHLARGRSGVLFGVRDAYAPAGPAGAEAWGGASLGPGAPLDAATALDAARAVRALEQSWPFDSIVGDRETGILVRSDRIVHVDLEGAYRIAGPLNAPEPPTGASVIAWLSRDAADLEGVTGPHSPVDLVIGHGGSVVLADDEDAAWAAGGAVDGVPPRGVLLRSVAGEGVAALLSSAERLLADGGLASVTPGADLRTALGLAATRRPVDGRPAFPAPEPNPSL